MIVFIIVYIPNLSMKFMIIIIYSEPIMGYRHTIK